MFKTTDIDTLKQDKRCQSCWYIVLSTMSGSTTVNNQDFIIHKLRYKKGRKHDYDIYKKNHPITHREVVNVFDLGYLGVETDFPEQLSVLPYRKKRNLELSQEEKDYNKNHSRKRIVIEHAICRLKKYRIMSDIFRNRLRKVQYNVRYSYRLGKL